MDWATAITAYLTYLKATNASDGTIRLRRYHLTRISRAFTAPRDVTTDGLMTYLSAPDWAANYRRSLYVTVGSFLKWAKRASIIPRNPLKGVRAVSAEVGHPRPAPEGVVSEAVRTVDARDRAMVRLAAWVGLRCCEICRVHSDDATERAGGWTLRIVGKGRRMRTVPIPSELGEHISRAGGWLFPGQIDGHLSAEYVSKRISRVLPRGWTAHTLRHRFASAAYVGADHDIRAVQELLGHASVATTQIYTATDATMMRQAVEHAAGRRRLAA